MNNSKQVNLTGDDNWACESILDTGLCTTKPAVH